MLNSLMKEPEKRTERFSMRTKPSIVGDIQTINTVATSMTKTSIAERAMEIGLKAIKKELGL